MEKLPGSLGCYVCGRDNPISLKLDFYVNENREVFTEFSFSENYAGYPGMVHGGNIVAVLDETAGRAVTIDDPDRFVVTSELKVKYLKPVPTDTPLVVIGKQVKQRGRLAVGYSELKSKDGVILATCEAYLVEVTMELTQENNLEESGWKVYPDD